MSKDLISTGGAKLPEQFGLKQPGDKFSAEITKTGKQVVKRQTEGGQTKEAIVKHKKKIDYTKSVPISED